MCKFLSDSYVNHRKRTELPSIKQLFRIAISFVELSFGVSPALSDHELESLLKVIPLQAETKFEIN